MQQLSGLDASFLYLETDNAPMHIASLGIYDPSTAEGGKVTFKQILANTMARKHRVPGMSNVLVNVPFRLDHPYWITNDKLDVEYHIRHMALPQPGDWRQLCILVSRLHARPMDRSRPLWEMNVIEGLDNVEGVPKGAFAIYLKVHHAAFDGASATEMAAVIHDMTADYQKNIDPERIQGEAPPSDLSLLMPPRLIRSSNHFACLTWREAACPMLPNWLLVWVKASSSESLMFHAHVSIRRFRHTESSKP